mgnify:FL=1
MSPFIGCPWPECRYGMSGSLIEHEETQVRYHLRSAHFGKMPDGKPAPVTAREQKQRGISFKRGG